MNRPWMPLIAAGLLIAGCHEVTGPGDRPPAAPRGVYSVTGDHEVTIHWLANTESDVAGYYVYQAPCSRGSDCPYDLVGTVSDPNGTSFVVTGLANGETWYYAVSAYDRKGHESDLSYDDVFDTSRPEGFGVTLNNASETVSQSGFDFSSYGTAGARRAWNDPLTDMYFTGDSVTSLMVVPSLSNGGIQDMGPGSSLDAVDYAPSSGWSPTGSVELIIGHNYVLWTRIGSPDVHYAKFRVTDLTRHRVTFDWAYQVAPGNRELRVRPARPAGIQSAVAE